MNEMQLRNKYGEIDKKIVLMGKDNVCFPSLKEFHRKEQKQDFQRKLLRTSQKFQIEGMFSK